MRVRVIRLWRDGVQIPRWQFAQQDPVEGELRIQEGNDELLRRHLRTAHLFDFSRDKKAAGPDAIPPLIDAAVLYVKGSQMSISGFERNAMLPTVAQTWLVEILAPE